MGSPRTTPASDPGVGASTDCPRAQTSSCSSCTTLSAALAACHEERTKQQDYLKAIAAALELPPESVDLPECQHVLTSHAKATTDALIGTYLELEQLRKTLAALTEERDRLAKELTMDAQRYADYSSVANLPAIASYADGRRSLGECVEAWGARIDRERVAAVRRAEAAEADLAALRSQLQVMAQEWRTKAATKRAHNPARLGWMRVALAEAKALEDAADSLLALSTEDSRKS